ncbi:MAG: hypothetical protein ING16_04455 [Roseomonas sp.]|jgi:hypothetical protein|nr:hypothetical protein [Roseomonas sp.]MCA3282101.1 hypothetical protein [Roseomonas sp.]MCA3298208.1 hypothetical protein [Roseomonas sp.]
MKVFIATPTIASTMQVETTLSIVHMVNELRDGGHGAEWFNYDGAYVTRARHILTSRFLARGDFTHLLFLDSDIGVPKGAITRLLRTGHEVIGLACPLRHFDITRFAEAAREAPEGLPDLARLNALSRRFNIEPDPSDPVIRNGLLRVNRIGFGCILIARTAFEKLIASGSVARRKSESFRQLGAEGEYWAFFDEMTLDEGFVSEDYAFCLRWLALPDNGIWALTDMPVAHIGAYAHRAAYLDRFRPPRS